MHLSCSVFPNCSAKAKGEKQTLIADQLAETNEISQLVLRRPMDRVRGKRDAEGPPPLQLMMVALRVHL